jgi:hypothetical protein
MLKDFHPSQITYILESRRTAKYGNIAAFSCGISLCIVCVLPSHWSAKLSNIGIASALFFVSHKLEKLHKWSEDYTHITNQQSAIGYRDHLSQSFAPPKREIAIAQPEIIKPIPTHPVLKALHSLKLECELVQELRSPSFIRTMVKPQNCTASKVLATGLELQLELGLSTPPVMSIAKGAIAIDTPRTDRQSARFADYWKPSQKLEVAIGVNIDNRLISIDLSQPESCHILGCGTTGSGKSIFLQSLLLSLLLAHSPANLQLLICDPKRVTFQIFKDSSNLIAPIMYEPDEAIAYLEQMVDQMEARYIVFERSGVENVETFNARSSEKLPRIVFLFDEFGDLWDCCTKVQVDKLENLIIRLGQKARAAGIHLIIFTQRPKKVVSPRLRSNCPARLLLTVADAADSEAILGNKSFDGSQLLGRGDLFFNGDRLQALLPDESDFAKLTRVDKLTQIDELTTVDALVLPSNSRSSPVNLSKPLQSILEYAQRQNDFVSASQIKSGVRLFRDTPVTEIRNYFQWLFDNGHGIVRGEADNLEFSAQ